MLIKRTHEFEFHIYDADARGPNIEVRDFEDKYAARRAGGVYAKMNRGPVDIAYAGKEPWEERYITTASPSDYTKSGYQFERIDS